MAHSTNEIFASVAPNNLSVEFFEINDPSSVSMKDKSLPIPLVKPSPMSESSLMPTPASFFLPLAETENLTKARLIRLKEKLKLWVHRE